MDTRAIMDLAVKLARQREVPEDSEIAVHSSKVRRVLFGIDADSGTLAAARALGYDLVVAHHPIGMKSELGILRVFEKHSDILRRHGVPAAAAKAAVRAVRAELEPGIHAMNRDLVSLARLLGLPFMNIHNPCDEIGRRIMDETLRRSVRRSSTVRDAISALEDLPEFAKADTEIVLRMGRPESRLGRWAVHHGAGTNGGYHVASAAFRHGIDTVVYIHIAPPNLKRLHDEFGARGRKNLIVTGHVASDSIGINVLVRALRERGLEVACVSGIVEA